jgi:hypothetical protein
MAQVLRSIRRKEYRFTSAAAVAQCDKAISLMTIRCLGVDYCSYEKYFATLQDLGCCTSRTVYHKVHILAAVPRVQFTIRYTSALLYLAYSLP